MLRSMLRNKKYMIYLIGGSPRGGKSILSRKLAKDLNIPYISTDNLRLVVMPYFKGKEKDKNFPFERMFDVAHIDRYFKKYTGQEMLQADTREAKTVWPGINSLIDYFLVCKMDYIIEGVHLLPNLVKKFKGNENIKIVFLTKINEEKIYEGLLKNKNNNDWITSNIKDERTISLASKSLCDYGKYFIKEANKYDFKIFNTEDDFVRKIKETGNYLKNKK